MYFCVRHILHLFGGGSGRFIIGGGSERYFIETIDLEERF
jgi:hypothetical protein